MCSSYLKATPPKWSVSCFFILYCPSDIADSSWITAFFFFLCKFRPIYSWVNLYSQPAGSHFGWASGPTTCFSLKINHHLWVLSIKKGAKKMGLHIFTTLWEKIISKLCFRSLWNKLKMRCLSLLQKSKL